MKSVWNELGFAETIYRVTPLEATANDYKLFTGRDAESDKFLSQMDHTDGALVVVSGDLGIGKTSFVNAQQYRIAARLAGWGPTLVPGYRLTPLVSTDDIASLARKVANDAVHNVGSFYRDHEHAVPATCATVRDWLSFKPRTSAYEISIAGFGGGRETTLPPANDATVDTWRDVLEALAAEAREELRVDGILVCLDNAETLSREQLTTLLMAYRDTLFAIKGIWWVLIGQSGLYGIIERIDRRVSQRIHGDGVEVSHLSAVEFHEVIERRVRAFAKGNDATTPLSKSIHERLYRAACGEVRFVFDTAGTLIDEVATQVRGIARDALSVRKAVATPVEREAALASAMRDICGRQIKDSVASTFLKQMAERATRRIRAELGTKWAQLSKGGKIVKDEFRRFGYSSREKFVSDFLDPLCREGVLARISTDSAQHYEVKGFARLLIEDEGRS